MTLKFVFNALSGSFDVVQDIDVSDEGVSQGAVTAFNFVGAGVVAAVASGTATVTIAGGAGGSGEPARSWMGM